VVVIGRNEAVGLERCLRSALREGVPVVYADSDSTDDSVRIAERLGVVVEPVPGRPHTAARGRNAGVRRLCAIWPQVEVAQFIDGDCELVPGWLSAAMAAMTVDDRIAVVCGRQRERRRNASIYARLLDIEWDRPLGDDVAEYGGAAFTRLSAFHAVGGYNADMPAGEEPELCLRLRSAGWRVRQIAAEMTIHDGRMTRFSQWWRRAERAGHAYAHGAALHFRSPPRLWLRQVASAWAWAIGLPLAGLLLGTADPRFAACVALAYPLQLVRIHLMARRRGLEHGDAALYAAACLLAKFPELLGQWRYLLSQPAPVPNPAATPRR
jgi:GT2 family glycosyltransferase